MKRTAPVSYPILLALAHPVRRKFKAARAPEYRSDATVWVNSTAAFRWGIDLVERVDASSALPSYSSCSL